MTAMTQPDRLPRAVRWGVRLPGRKELSVQAPVLHAPPPRRVILSLHQNIGEPSRPIVDVGTRVSTGQPLSAAQPGSLSTPVHASISGHVTAIEEHRVPEGGTATCIVIMKDGPEQTWQGYPGNRRPEHLQADEIRTGILDAGIVGLGGAMFPTRTKLNPGTAINTLILNGAECEPYISCDQALMTEKAHEVLLGAVFMLRALQTDRCIVAIRSGMVKAEHALRSAMAKLNDARIELAVVPNRYPAGGERQLIEVLLGTEVPSGGLPRDIGAVCQNVATAAAVAKFFNTGEPLISRIVTVTGTGVRQPRNIEARIGTPVNDLVEMAGGYTADANRLVMGGPMMGIALTDDELPMTKATNCILVAGHDELAPPPPERPCIRCQECTQVCPARLMPADLMALGRKPDLEQLEARGIEDCIECGACDYVCPSAIPLTKRLIIAKDRVRQRQADQRQAAHARQRFEAREQRLHRNTEQQNDVLDRQVAEISESKEIGQQTIDELKRRAESVKRSSPDQSNDE
jgi:electron transport complex protein RnfC